VIGVWYRKDVPVHVWQPFDVRGRQLNLSSSEKRFNYCDERRHRYFNALQLHHRAPFKTSVILTKYSWTANVPSERNVRYSSEYRISRWWCRGRRRRLPWTKQEINFLGILPTLGFVGTRGPSSPSRRTALLGQSTIQIHVCRLCFLDSSFKEDSTGRIQSTVRFQINADCR
jgi:hypothetical protein